MDRPTRAPQASPPRAEGLLPRRKPRRPWWKVRRPWRKIRRPEWKVRRPKWEARRPRRKSSPTLLESPPPLVESLPPFLESPPPPAESPPPIKESPPLLAEDPLGSTGLPPGDPVRGFLLKDGGPSAQPNPPAQAGLLLRLKDPVARALASATALRSQGPDRCRPRRAFACRQISPRHSCPDGSAPQASAMRVECPSGGLEWRAELRKARSVDARVVHIGLHPRRRALSLSAAELAHLWVRYGGVKLPKIPPAPPGVPAGIRVAV